MIRGSLTQSNHRKTVCVLLLAGMGLLAACGQDTQTKTGGAETAQIEKEEPEASQSGTENFMQEQVIDAPEVMSDAGAESDVDAENAEDPETTKLQNRFGENCISAQTFEVELSEYDGKVWFVPYVPAEEGQALDIQIVQDGNILTQLYPFVPEQLEGQPFTSLDAVSFFDINCDNNTDIVLIETYGDTSFAAVYYGFAPDVGTEERFFMAQWSLSEAISSKLNPLTIGELRKRLGGKNNGEFTSYREAYAAVARLWALEYESELSCDLIYVDGDDTPELTVGLNGAWVSLYTYHDGRVYLLMDRWGYGVMGNVGYEYIPKGNRIRNYNNDYAGAIHYATYLTIGDQHSIETVTQIVTYHFDDANGNGMPDEEEEDSIGYYSVSYADGAEITGEQYAAYDAGEYAFIAGHMSLDELLAALAQ